MNTSIDYIQVLILTEFCFNSERVITRHKTAFLNPGVSRELRNVPGLQRKTALGGDKVYMLQSEMSSVSSSHTPTGGKARGTSEFPAASTYLAFSRKSVTPRGGIITLGIKTSLSLCRPFGDGAKRWMTFQTMH